MRMETMIDRTEDLSKTEKIKTLSEEKETSPMENEDFLKDLEEAKIKEEKVPEKIISILEEIKEFKSPEELKNEIKRLQKEYEEKKKIWSSFINISRIDTGLGALGAFSSGKEGSAKLEEKFPGISKVLEVIKLAEKKNNVGLKFWKRPELGDFEYQIVKNYLITGDIGIINNPTQREYARRFVNKFLAENSQNGENISNLKKVIWGEHDSRYYEETISNLNKKLTQINEATK